MICGSCLTVIILACSISNTDSTAIKEWTNNHLLSENEFQSQIQSFIKNHIPDLKLPSTAEEWQKESEKLRQKILANIVYGGVPEEWYEGDDPQIIWGDTIKTEKGYIIRKLRYEALPGLWIPALLYMPDEVKGKVPAILNVNGHVGPPGKTQDYEQLRCINLVKRGMLAFHPEWLVFGELANEDLKHNRLAYLDLCGTCGLSVFYLAMKRGIDVLLKHPSTDPEKVAMTGLSGGGWQTIVLSSLDTRIAATAPNAGYIGMNYRADFIEDCGDLEQNPNDLLTIADYTHLTAMLAPRPTLLIYNEKDDCCFQTHRARPSIYEPIIPFFKLFGKENVFSLHNNIDPGTHNYDKDNREQFYKFINKYFLKDQNTIDEEIPSNDEILKYEDLIVGIPENNANFYTLAKDIMKDFPKNRPPQSGTSDFIEWQKNGRDKLKEIIRLKPMKAQAQKLSEDINGNLKVWNFKITVNNEFSIPAIAISPSEKVDSIVVMFADKGKHSLGDYIQAEIEKGSTVIALDPIFMGENMTVRGGMWQYVQMVSAIGERSLGLQVGHIGAIVEMICQAIGVPKVSLYSVGWNSGVVALMVGALFADRIESITLKDHLQSLKLLIENHIDYDAYPTLFCFGLLKEFDIDEIMALCSPIKINLDQSK
ncbi:MAG: alpha/beta hydrolase family protein [Candidatus Poribacteria bacterium]